MFPQPAINEVSILLKPGDTLALYTDGLPEAHAPARLIAARDIIAQLESTRPLSAKSTVDCLLALIDPDDNVRDDIAILTAQVNAKANQA